MMQKLISFLEWRKKSIILMIVAVFPLVILAMRWQVPDDILGWVILFFWSIPGGILFASWATLFIGFPEKNIFKILFKDAGKNYLWMIARVLSFIGFITFPTYPPFRWELFASYSQNGSGPYYSYASWSLLLLISSIILQLWKSTDNKKWILLLILGIHIFALKNILF